MLVRVSCDGAVYGISMVLIARRSSVAAYASATSDKGRVMSKTLLGRYAPTGPGRADRADTREPERTPSRGEPHQGQRPSSTVRPCIGQPRRLRGAAGAT